MSWTITANMIEFCSCKVMCPCWLGPETQPDEGWCAGAIAYDIQQGSIDGVDVGGCKAVLAAEWPGNFFGGQGKARLYVDARASDAQRRAMEEVFRGRKGGLFEGLMGAVITQWLPTKTAPIDIQRGNGVSLSVGDFGKATITPYKDVKVQGTAAQGAFQSSSMELGSSKGTRWSDPDLRSWEGDSATLHSVRWSA